MEKYRGKPFCSVDKFENALFSDLLQEIINSDFPVYGMEANSGWLEIHSFEDYKMACTILSKPACRKGSSFPPLILSNFTLFISTNSNGKYKRCGNNA
jgi:NDP-sugar pyrophosphorylase family protein